MNDLRVVRIDEIWYVPISDVSSVGNVSGDVVVSLKNDKNWTQIYFTPGSVNFEEAYSDEGRIWCIAQRLTFTVPGEDKESTDWVDEYNNRPVLIKLVQNNGSKLLGAMDPPCRMRISSSLSESGFTVRVERKSKEKARWLT